MKIFLSIVFGIIGLIFVSFWLIIILSTAISLGIKTAYRNMNKEGNINAGQN